MLQHAFEDFTAALATSDGNFQRLSPRDRAEAFLSFWGAETRKLGAGLKEPDEVVVLEGVQPTVVPLTLEIAYHNESGSQLAREVWNWAEHGNALFGLGVKVSSFRAACIRLGPTHRVRRSQTTP
jgi:hypothetical protein